MQLIIVGLATELANGRGLIGGGRLRGQPFRDECTTVIKTKGKDYFHGRRLRGDWGRSLFEMGDRPYIRPPNILRSTVIACEAKYELTKNGSQREIFV